MKGIVDNGKWAVKEFYSFLRPFDELRVTTLSVLYAYTVILSVAYAESKNLILNIPP